MTNDPSNKAPREFWIYDNGEWFGSLVSTSPVDREDFVNQKTFDEVIHVIEHSAYEKLKAENARLRHALKKCRVDFVSSDTEDRELGTVNSAIIAVIDKALKEPGE